MAAKKKAEERRGSSHYVQLKLSPDDHDILTLYAFPNGKTVSGVVHAVLRNAINQVCEQLRNGEQEIDLAEFD